VVCRDGEVGESRLVFFEAVAIGIVGGFRFLCLLSSEVESSLP
jgi:hypothetical protein